jgi:hypothetical protein
VSDKPILFSAPMVRAILREVEAPGTGKTQTRRVLTPAKLRIWTGGLDHSGRYVHPSPELFRAALNNPRSFKNVEGRLAWVTDPAPHQAGAAFAQWLGQLPYGVGDRLWVRESLQVDWMENLLTGERTTNAAVAYYAADDAECLDPAGFNLSWIWQRGTLPSIHMPRSFSRLTLIVTDVRVQRLHDISEADAMAEGVIFNAGLPADVHRHCIPIGDGEVISGWDARECFSQLWDHINSPGAWQANPWVVAYSFRPILGNTDAGRRALAEAEGK